MKGTGLLLTVAGLVVAPLAFIGYLMAKYNPARRDSNVWTVDGLWNLLRLWPHFEAVLAATNGRLTSGFRSPEYNASTPGSSKTSDHMYGAAIDVSPGGGMTAKEAADRVFTLAKAGALGDVSQVIEEYRDGSNPWLHVGWNHRKNSGRKVARLTLHNGKSATV